VIEGERARDGRKGEAGDVAREGKGVGWRGRGAGGGRRRREKEERAVVAVIAVVTRKRTRAWAEGAEIGREKSRVVTAKMQIRRVNLVGNKCLIHPLV
jgi:hypothetical protein